MLKYLRISNLMLVEMAELSFARGFTVLTGETGAGKSAVITALGLLLGARADAQSLRSGCSRGFVEGAFDIDALPEVQRILCEAGIEHDAQEDVLLRRDFSSGGKSRSFVNNQSAHLVLLRQLSPYLLHRVGPSASEDLRSVEYHRTVLDAFGALQEQKRAFADLWAERCQLQRQIEKWYQSESQRLRERDSICRELEEIQSSCLGEGEEEELQRQWRCLSQADSVLRYAAEVEHCLSLGEQSIMARLSRQRGALESLAEIDGRFQELLESFESATVELQELGRSLQLVQTQVSTDPESLEEVERRLAAFQRLKRKFGLDAASIQQTYERLRERLAVLDGEEQCVADWETRIREVDCRCDELAATLSEQRREVAQRLTEAMTEQLRGLQMPNAVFAARVSQEPRSSQGDDRVEFFLAPNLGEAEVSVREQISGGELARVLLALKTLLAGKEPPCTLVFDELDAHIGGQTAVAVGKKLLEIASSQQVIAITHFPQLAEQGQRHLAIAKGEVDGRTLTSVSVLEGEACSQELGRMRGECMIPA